MRAEQAAVAATIECHNLQEEVNNVGIQQSEWQKARAIEHFRLTEELRRARVELRQARGRAKGARMDVLKLSSRIQRLQVTPLDAHPSRPSTGATL